MITWVQVTVLPLVLWEPCLLKQWSTQTWCCHPSHRNSCFCNLKHLYFYIAIVFHLYRKSFTFVLHIIVFEKKHHSLHSNFLSPAMSRFRGCSFRQQGISVALNSSRLFQRWLLSSQEHFLMLEFLDLQRLHWKMLFLLQFGREDSFVFSVQWK